MNKLKALATQVEDNGTIEVVASSANTDRDGDVMIAEGWELKNFLKNPLILWSHNPTLPPIGKATRVWIEKGLLKAKILFDMADPFAQMIYRKFQEGFLKAVSVGFIPKEQNERGEWVKQELLEISAVGIPANADALRTANYKKFESEVKSFEKKAEKSPAYRMPNETMKECVARKIPELVDEGMKQDQAVAVANSLCKKTKPKEEAPKETPKDEPKKETIKAEESTKNIFRNTIDMCKQTASALEEVLGRTESLSKGESSKIVVKATSADEKVRQANRVASRAVEIALSELNKKLK
jgi:HK97 family phage prohead protease